MASLKYSWLLRSPSTVNLFQKKALQIGFVCLGIDRPCLAETGLLLRRQLQLNLTRHRCGHFPLQLQDIPQIALVALGPHVGFVAHLNERRGDAYPSTSTPRTSFEQVVHAEFATDLRGALRAVFVLHRRG